MTDAIVNPLAKPATAATKIEEAKTAAAVLYRTHTAPGSIVFASGRRQNCPDGIIRPTNEEEAAELEAAADCGNISRITDDEAAAIVSVLTTEAASNISGLK